MDQDFRGLQEVLADFIAANDRVLREAEKLRQATDEWRRVAGFPIEHKEAGS